MRSANSDPFSRSHGQSLKRPMKKQYFNKILRHPAREGARSEGLVMRIAFGRRRPAAEPRVSLVTRLNSVWVAPCVLAAAACAGILAGCHTNQVIWDAANAAQFTGSTLKNPLPSQTLLAQLSQPDCEYRTQADDGKSEGTKSRSDIDADQAYRVKLEHERECYREAEIRARERLNELQAWVAKSTGVVQPQGTRRPIGRADNPQGFQAERSDRIRRADP